MSSLSAQDQEQKYFIIAIELVTDLPSDSLVTSPTYSPKVETEVSTYFTVSAEDELTPKGENPEVIPNYFRAHKLLPEKFSGYVIELLQTDEKLAKDYPLFERYGNIHVQQLKNGKYSYCIIPNFNRSKSVKIFAEQVIRPQVPDAQVIRYKRGKRKRM